MHYSSAAFRDLGEAGKWKTAFSRNKEMTDDPQIIEAKVA